MENKQSFINLFSQINTSDAISVSFNLLKDEKVYNDNFKTFHGYKKDYHDRLHRHKKKYNNYANELHFINSELKDFNKLICFSLKVDWSENLEEWDIVERLHSLKPIRFSDKPDEVMYVEHMDLLVEMFLYLHDQQKQIVKHLMEIQALIIAQKENTEIADKPVVGTLTKDQKLVMLHELGVLDFLKSKDCKYANQKDRSALSLNKIAGILTELVDCKQTTIQPSLSKLMSSDGTMTKSNIDSVENQMQVKNFLKKHGLIKKD